MSPKPAKARVSPGGERKWEFYSTGANSLLEIRSGGGEQSDGNSVDFSATGHCRLAHANKLQMSGHARFPRIRVFWMVGAVVNDNVLEIEGA